MTLFTLASVSMEIGGRPLLRDLDFSIAAGERVVLLGVNGCGKTTLLKMLDGLLFPTRGAISYEGLTLDAKALQDPVFRRRFRGEVALLFQNVDAMLFNPSVADEIAFGPRQLGVPDAEARAARWAERLGVTPFLERAPFELSGGEKKRVALAAIMAMEPKVLLLDEPNESLDPVSLARLVDLLAGLNSVTVIASTHNLSLVEEFGQRAILLGSAPASVMFDGPPSQLLADERLLIESGLAHRHRHRHEGAEHEHYHVHDGD